MTVSLALAKQQVRVTNTVEDDLIEIYLAAAKAWVENYTGNKLVRGDVEQRETSFGSYVPLRWGPDPASASVAYIGTDDLAGTMADALILGDRLYAPARGWPSIASSTPIIVTYTAGFADTPADLDYAVLLLVADAFMNREAGSATPATTRAVEALCNPYRSVLV